MSDDRFVFAFTPEQLRRLRWKNLSPVVERVRGGGILVARHADGRFTIEDDNDQTQN